MLFLIIITVIALFLAACQSDMAGEAAKAARCTDECVTGQTACSGTSYKTCGNYDKDKCLEFSSPIACPAGQTCSGGKCVAACTNECSSTDLKECADSMNYRTCGNYDADTCLEWSATTNCPYGCQNGACNAGCTNQCGNGNCDDAVCQGTGCACVETQQTCPQDCTSGTSYTLPLTTGWNAVSSPITEGITLDQIRLKCQLETVYYWNPSTRTYSIETTKLQAGKGYWVPVMSDCTFTATGTPYAMQPMNITAGYSYFIGAPATTASVSEISGNCANRLSVYSPHQDANGDVSYTPAYQLASGKGYWINSSSNCVIGSAGCVDECKVGVIFCTSSTSLSVCGNFDSDNCLDWGAPTNCSYGCQNGACNAGCTNQCGNGICDNAVCQGISCPCVESQNTCPQDCSSGNTTEPPTYFG
jgi:hypothetical protein